MQLPFHLQKRFASSSSAEIETVIPYITTPSLVPVIGIQLQKAKLKLKTGHRAELTATVLPSQASNQEIIWTCTNPHIVEIHTEKQKTIVIGKQAGRAVIIATTAEGKFRDLCIVNVHPYLINPK